MSDDLGQIQYIFSDKTGTLTQVCSHMSVGKYLYITSFFFLQNSMVFRHCSIGGKVYKGDPDPLDGEGEFEPDASRPPEPKPEEDIPNPGLSRISEGNEVRLSSVSSTAVGSGATNNKSEKEVAKPTVEDPVKDPENVLIHFRDATLKADLEEAAGADHVPEQASHARSLNGFFTVLALCHTVLSATNPDTGALEYKAQSPDEAALVRAASDVGFVFLGRDRETLRLQTPFSDEPERYELLNILEFTSARKRMSVVLKKMGDDKRLFLLTKGADSVIFERLKPGGDELKQLTLEQLAEFASSGLRTLTLAYKVISGESCGLWQTKVVIYAPIS